MKKLYIYLDTSVWNFVFADDAPEKKEATLEFFKCVEKGQYQIFIGTTVLEEIRRTHDEGKLKQLMGLIDKYQPTVLEITKEVDSLSRKYMAEGVISNKKVGDSRHIAFAVINEMDVLLSWNYRDLANLNKKLKVEAVNFKEGYTKPMEFITPYEVIGDEN